MPKSRFGPIRAVLLISLVSMLVSCSNQGNQSANDASTTTPTTTPFQFTFSSDPQDTLNELASNQGAIDQSKISLACGVSNALIVETAGVRYFRWSNSAWVEHFDFPNPEATDSPYVVTTRDYTGDGLLDYLVSFRKTASYGGILSSSGPSCDWRWLTFTFPEGGSSVLVDNLSWSDESMALSGLNKNGINPTANLRFFFDAKRLEFVGQDDPYSNPDMAWMGDACETERPLYNELMDAVDIGDPDIYFDFSDGMYVRDLLAQWRNAIDDANRSFQTVGSYTLNLTSREINYLNDLFVPPYRKYTTGQWYIQIETVTLAHDRLQAYCEMLPPRL
jgi:hypothetical protein